MSRWAEAKRINCKSHAPTTLSRMVAELCRIPTPLHRIDIDSFDHRRFPRIRFGYDHPRDLAAASLNRDQKRTTNSAKASVQGGLMVIWVLGIS